MAEQIKGGLALGTEITVLNGLENKYLKARVVELNSLLDYLLRNGQLDPNQLHGPIIDLGAGSGVGLLALRQFTLGHLLGIDDAHRQRYHSYAGQYDVPVPEITNLAVASFRREDMHGFLSRYPLESATLVTAFYASTKNWHNKSCPTARVSIFGCRCGKVLETVNEVGKILKPGGQFLFTSDEYDIPNPRWATDTVDLTGSETEEGLMPFIVPVPPWVRDRYQYWFKDIEYFVQPKLIETNGASIGLLRDRLIRVFTKSKVARV